jgi:UDPglucose 6-dehydrogenase
MKISVIGGGYVGLIMAAGMAEIGHTVICAENDAEKYALLSAGKSPIYERGLSELLQNETNKNLHFVLSVDAAIIEAHIVFVCVGTPSKSDGSADLSAVFKVAHEIGKNTNYAFVIAMKSTVPVGTCKSFEEIVNHELALRGKQFTCTVVSNPEFLKEGNALEDFRRPDRIVIGSSDPQAIEVMRRAYSTFTRNHDRTIVVQRESAELGKYASNAMLATRISFMNELSAISEKAGSDIEEIRQIMGSDSRIGPKFLYAGPGFGGSCFPKDLQALMQTGDQLDVPTALLKAVFDVNKRQKTVLAEKARDLFASFENKKFTVWGISYKPETDDIRESPAICLIEDLLNEGAQVNAYDPMVKSINDAIDQKITFFENMYEAAIGSDCLILVTEWKAFKSPDFSHLSSIMRSKHLIDGRNIWERDEVRNSGFTYSGIGKS